MTLTAAGVGSGIDVEGILSSLNEIDRLPIDALEENIEELDVELSAFGRVESALSTFQTAVDTLGSSSDFGAFVASSSDEDVLIATAVNGETAENLDIQVVSLATNHRLSSGSYTSASADVEQGTLSFSSNSNEFDIVIDETNNTLSSVRDAINNSADNSSVSASIINVDGGNRLILTATESGTEGMISVTRDSALPLGDGDAGFDEITEATDANLIVHGFEVTRSSNTINDIISGITLDLTGVGTSTVDSRRDLESLELAMDEFVTGYNSLSNVLESVSATDLNGDQLPRGIETRFQNLFFSPVDLGDGDSASTLDMGFTFDRNGTLSIDTNRFETALGEGVNRFVEAFSKDETGLSTLFSGLIDEYIQAGGIISDREDGIDTRRRSIETQIDRLEYRLEISSARLRAQFTAMDLAVTNLQTTSGFLTNSL